MTTPQLPKRALANARWTATAFFAVRAVTAAALLLAVVPATAFASLSGLAGPMSPAMTAGTRPDILPVAVFGKDERTALPKPLTALGRQIGLLINRNAKSACTAFCVAPNVIATAAHCLLDGADTARFKAGTQWFVLERKGRRAMSRISGFGRGAAEQNVLLGAFKLRTQRPIDAGGDWALVRLSRPACDGHAMKIGNLPAGQMESEAAAGRIFQIGFHRDVANWKITYSGACPVRRNFEDPDWGRVGRDFTSVEKLILHRCDTGPASSGSPLLWESPDGPVVVGINVGTYGRKQETGTKAETNSAIANTGIAALAFMDFIPEFATADVLVAREPILELQDRLLARGLYAGPRDGRFGPLLRVAIAAYQHQAALPVTGVPTQQLLDRLANQNP